MLARACVRSTVNGPIRYRIKHHFASLDSTRLSNSDFVDFSGTVRPHVTYYPISLLRGRCTSKISIHTLVTDCKIFSPDPKAITGRVHYLDDGRRRGVLPFPPNSHGFLYYAGPDMHPAACEIRLRLALSPETQHFHTGKDLLLPDGRAWSIPVPRTHAELYSPFRDWLIDTSRVTQDTLNEWTAVPITKKTQVIHSLGQPFLVTFSKCTHAKLWVARGLKLRRIILDLRKLWHAPYEDTTIGFTGSAWCALERYPAIGVLPTSKSHHTLALRLLSFVKPLKAIHSSGIARPPVLIPGELVARNRFTGPAQPMLFRMDSPDLEALKWLLPESELAMQPTNGPEAMVDITA